MASVFTSIMEFPGMSLDQWALTIIAVLIAITFSAIEFWLEPAKRTWRKALFYIGYNDRRSQPPFGANREVPVSHALVWIIYSSAWMKWMEAQHLADKGKRYSDFQKMKFAKVAIQRKVSDGDLPIKGRLRGKILFETIEKDIWHILALDFETDVQTLWRFKLVVRNGVNDELAKKVPDYDSLVVNETAVMNFWPKSDAA